MHLTTYWGALAAMAVLTVMNFGRIGMKSILLTWLFAGLGGFLVAVYFMKLIGFIITAFGAITLYMNANSSSME